MTAREPAVPAAAAGAPAAAGSEPAPGGTQLLAGRPVARIGYGVMQLEQQHAEPAAAHSLLRQAAAAGVNHLDTAQFYGECNTFIREALAPFPPGLALVTKVGAERNPGGALVPAQRPGQLRAQVEANLLALGTDQVTVANLRRLDAAPGIIAEGDQVVDLDSQLAELIELRAAGKIGGIGLSNVSADQLRRALPAGIACVQNIYSLIERSAEPVLDACRANGIAWVPFFPLGSAMPGRPRVTDHPLVIAAARELAATPAQVALAWLLAHAPQVLLIPGTASAQHLTANIAAGALRLPARTVAGLDLGLAEVSPMSVDRELLDRRRAELEGRYRPWQSQTLGQLVT